MNKSSRESLREAFPQIPEDELNAIEERLRRYVFLAIAVANSESQTPRSLTEPSAGGRVNEGKVDPSTLENTG
jgi:hypothetical protein